jgi:hypothetical protein
MAILMFSHLKSTCQARLRPIRKSSQDGVYAPHPMDFKSFVHRCRTCRTLTLSVMIVSSLKGRIKNNLNIQVKSPVTSISVHAEESRASLFPSETDTIGSEQVTALNDLPIRSWYGSPDFVTLRMWHFF